MIFTSGTAAKPNTYVLNGQTLGAIVLSKLSYITIQGGKFFTLNITGCSNITITNVNIQAPEFPTSNAQAVRFYNSTNCILSYSTINGSVATKTGVDPKTATLLDSTGNVLGFPTGKGVYVDQSCSNITIMGNTITKFHKGIVFSGNNITINSNIISNLRTTPISGSPGTNCKIIGNKSTDSFPFNFGPADHGDRIHLWTNKTVVTGLVISKNTLLQGTGTGMLGIYLDDNSKGLGFQNPVITYNTIVDGQGQGMTLEKVFGTSATNLADISHNNITWSGSGDAYHNTPRIYVTRGCKYVKFAENVVPITFSKYISTADKATITIK